MNVTAFVRQTATAKKKATIYIRVHANEEPYLQAYYLKQPYS